jgi:hypothetical protein
MRDSSLDEFLSDPDEESEESEADANEDETVGDRETEHAEPGPDHETGTGSEPETDEADGNEETNESVGDPPSTAEVEPARSTYAWSPEGRPCEACGKQVEERWESADGLVCVTCKEW